MGKTLQDGMKFYKYKSLRNMNHIKEIIGNNKIWAASPLDFNDPFDCRPFIDTECKAVEMLNFWKKQGKIERKAKLRDVYPRIKGLMEDLRESAASFTSDFNDVLKKYGIVSFSENCNGLLMWSHYADSHKGVCIEISLRGEAIEAITRSGIVIKKVDYEEYRPVINIVNNKILSNYQKKKKYLSSDPEYCERLIDFLNDVVFTKSENWVYEKEWRWLKRLNGRDRHINLPQGCISKVIMGVNSSPEDRMKIEEIISNNKLTIPVVDAVFDGKRYGIKV